MSLEEKIRKTKMYMLHDFNVACALERDGKHERAKLFLDNALEGEKELLEMSRVDYVDDFVKRIVRLTR